MFDLYDNSNRIYKIVFSSNKEELLTKQEFYEWFLLSEHGIKTSFESVVSTLENGESLSADEYDYDWGLGINVYKGKLRITKVSGYSFSPPQLPNTNCSHKNKYINHAGNIKFWYCKDCKSDLGDA